MKKQNEAKKVRSMIVTILLLSSVMLILATPMAGVAYETQDDPSIFGLTPSSGDVEVGDDFYLNVFVNSNASQPAYGWKVENMTYNYERIGMCNATEVNILAYGYWTTSANVGTIHNDYSYVWNSWATNTPTTSTSDNVTGQRINFTALSCGQVYFNMTGGTTKIYDELGNAYPGEQWHNTSVVIHPADPAAIGATMWNHTAINLTFAPGAGGNITTLCGKTGSYPTSPSDSIIYNGTNVTFNHTSLTPCTTYWYRAWTWNDTAKLHSETYRQASAMTQCYTNFTFTGVVPENDSTTTNCTYDIYTNLTVRNSKGKLANVYINVSDGTNHNWPSHATNVSIGAYSYGLSHNTTYWWNVTAVEIDGSEDKHTVSYHFTTGKGGGSAPSAATNPSPTSGTTSVPTNLGTFSVDVSDPDSDDLDVYFYWSNGTEIANVSNVQSGATATINPTLVLENSTRYFWYVVMNDTCLATETPAGGARFWFDTDDLETTLVKTWSVLANNTIEVKINASNTGQANFTNNLVINETYDSDVTFVGSSPAYDVGDIGNWTIPYLNMTGYPGHWYEITIWLTLNRVANGTTVSNTASSIYSPNGTILSTSTPAGLTMSYFSVKDANITSAKWNTSSINWTIDITNTGDFYLNWVQVNESYGTNISYSSSRVAPNGTNETFNITQIAPSATYSLWIITNTSYVTDSAPLVNATRTWNNLTVTANESSSELPETDYVFTGARTTQLKVSYVSIYYDMIGLSNTLFQILGVVIVIASVLVIVGMMYMGKRDEY